MRTQGLPSQHREEFRATDIHSHSTEGLAMDKLTSTRTLLYIGCLETRRDLDYHGRTTLGELDHSKHLSSQLVTQITTRLVESGKTGRRMGPKLRSGQGMACTQRVPTQAHRHLCTKLKEAIEKGAIPQDIDCHGLKRP